MSHPIIIQGGMGVAVSGWRLAREVSKLGQLGVVSGTLLAVVVARQLQQGDPGGHLRRALDHFPIPAVATRVLDRYYVPGGKPADRPFAAVPMPSLAPSAALTELTVAANFAEVFLAKEGHDGLVGLNLLEKIAYPTLPSLYGAMLAGVDYVLMGAGIPRAIPGALDNFARGVAFEREVPVIGTADGAGLPMRFDPAGFFAESAGHGAPVLRRPKFLAIVSSATLAATLARKSNGRVDGFVVEGEPAGGHNAPPRGPLQLNAAGEPIYGPRDAVDLAKIRELGLPFWLAGDRARPGRLKDALTAGAAGVQIGTAFAFCRESGLSADIRARVAALSRAGRAGVLTDPLASPTGFPFKVVKLAGTLSESGAYGERERVCDLGYLRQAELRADGTVGYRCAAEPEDAYVRKGGEAADCAGRKCLCNALLAAVGLAQAQCGPSSGMELPLVTAGTDVADIARYLGTDAADYGAADVVRMTLADLWDERAGAEGRSPGGSVHDGVSANVMCPLTGAS